LRRQKGERKMTRCEEFYEKVERDGNFCNMDRIAYQRTVDYIAFCKAINVPLGTLSERAARHVIKEKDTVVKAKVIEKLGAQLNKKKKPTVAQVVHLVDDTREGKDHGGRPLKESDNTETIEQVVTKTDVGEDNDPDIETVVEDFVDPADDDVCGVQDIPDMPALSIGEIVGTGKEMPPEEVVTEEEDEEEDEEDTTPDNPEITEKVVKEYLRNAGHEVAPQKKNRIPTEGAKQAIFDTCVKQAFEWEMDGDEIARRTKKAIMYVYPSSLKGEK
jgi:hypothetical protein